MLLATPPVACTCTGEEVVTKESFISICWRLIPYWLNNWEQQWGAECSSMMFELPHFAVELLVILPCVQVRIEYWSPVAARMVIGACDTVLFIQPGFVVSLPARKGGTLSYFAGCQLGPCSETASN